MLINLLTTQLLALRSSSAPLLVSLRGVPRDFRMLRSGKITPGKSRLIFAERFKP